MFVRDTHYYFCLRYLLYDARLCVRMFVWLRACVCVEKSLTLHFDLGDFGDVSKGVLNDGIHTRTIAVKSLKDGFSGPQKLDFLAEASIMGQFDHPNVIRLEGVVTRSRPLMIITEFMENGSLQAFIRVSRLKPLI